MCFLPDVRAGDLIEIRLGVHVAGDELFLKFPMKYPKGKWGKIPPTEWRCDVSVFET